MLGNLNLQVTGNCDLATSTNCTNFFSSYHWCWKLKNYCEAINIAIVCSDGVSRLGLGLETCLETSFLESRSWSRSRTSQVSSRSRSRTISVSVSSPWSRGPWSQVKTNVCSIWPFAQISDDFYNLDIWRCAFYFVTSLFKELVLITIIEMWGLESRSRSRTSRSRSRLLWQSLGLVSKSQPGLGLGLGGYGLDYITDCMYNSCFTAEKPFGVWQSSLIWILLNSRTLK